MSTRNGSRPTHESANAGPAVVLDCHDLYAGYDGVSVVRAVDLAVREREIVALLGPNGAGKTTTLLTLAGLLPAIKGQVTGPAAASRRALRRRTSDKEGGVVLVPDDRSLFTTLTARENLTLAGATRRPVLDDVLAYFPQLAPRLDVRAGLLSGGEQQMLAIARALVRKPRALLIDELSMGLAPVVVGRLLQILTDIARDTGAGIVLVEQHVRLALGIAHRAVVLVHGQKVLERPAADLLMSDELERAYLAS